MTWEKICISDLGRVVTGDTPPKNRPEYYGSAYPFIKPTDMKIGHRYTHSYEESYSDQASEKYIKKLIPENSTAVVTIGSIGQKLTLTHAPCFVNQAVNAVIPDESKFNPLYVFYLLRHNLHLVKNADTGASSGRENVSKSNFSGLELLATLDLNEQGRIAAALDSQDSLIENNRRRIILLEEAAQLLRHKFYADIGEHGLNGNLTPSLTQTTLATICDQIKVPADPAKIASETPYLSMEHMTPKSISLGEWDTAGMVGSLKLQFQENDVLFGRIRPYFHKVGIDVRPYREVLVKGINGKAVDECFKDGKHPFRIAVVCAMWLTGFDVKALATLYLDKPMKGHTLMQAIARVNRVAANKKNGLIIDYNGMLKSLRKALATYAQGDKGKPADPLFDEDQALAEYSNSIDKVQAHLATVGFDLDALVRAEEGEETWAELLNAQNAVSTSAECKKTFQVLAEDVFDRFRGLFPNPGVFKYEPQENAISAIYNLLQKPKPKVDIAAIMQEIRGVIDTSLEVAPKGQINQTPKQYDLSRIDFERLRVEFAKSPFKETAVLTLQERIQARLDRMMAENPGRIDLYKRYQDIIAEYNNDKDDAEIQRVFEDLMKLHDSLDQEEQRYVREGFKSDKELAVFDLLSKDNASITKGDIEKIKKVAQELMQTVETRRYEMGDLRDRAAAQAQMKAAIIDRMLEGMPDEYSSEDIEVRAEVIYQYVQKQMQSAMVH